MDIEAVIIVVLVSLIILSISSSYINIFMAAVFHQVSSSLTKEQTLLLHLFSNLYLNTPPTDN